MAKFYGIVGYIGFVEKERGIQIEESTEREYFGDILNNTRALHKSEYGVNDDVNLTGKISIVADPYAYENYFNIRYVIVDGVKWRVSTVEPMRPRMILTLGGVYNGED